MYIIYAYMHAYITLHTNMLQKLHFCSMRLAKVNPKHMSRHTGEKLYPCLHCPAEYVTAVLFQIHNLKLQDTPEFYAAKLFLSKVKNRCYFRQLFWPCYSHEEAHKWEIIQVQKVWINCLLLEWRKKKLRWTHSKLFRVLKKRDNVIKLSVFF